MLPAFSACCIQKRVQRQCMAACTFDIDLSVLARIPNPLLCASDLPHFIGCAAGKWELLSLFQLNHDCFREGHSIKNDVSEWPFDIYGGGQKITCEANFFPGTPEK